MDFHVAAGIPAASVQRVNNEKFRRYNNSPPYVTTRWRPQRISPLNFLVHLCNLKSESTHISASNQGALQDVQVVYPITYMKRVLRYEGKTCPKEMWCYNHLQYVWIHCQLYQSAFNLE